VDNPVDRPVDKCVQDIPVDKSPFHPQLIHNLSTIFRSLYPQAEFDTGAGLKALIHISTAPTTTITNS
jgi:hypothetical protein